MNSKLFPKIAIEFFGVNEPKNAHEINSTFATICKINFAIVLFALVLLASESFAATNQGSCGTLSSANTVYTLNKADSFYVTTGTCFTVTAVNVTINCAGHKLTGNNASGCFWAGWTGRVQEEVQEELIAPLASIRQEAGRRLCLFAFSLRNHPDTASQR